MARCAVTKSISRQAPLARPCHDHGVPRDPEDRAKGPRGPGSWNIEEGIPDLDLLWRLLKNWEEGFHGSFLGLPKESFTATFDPSGDFWKAIRYVFLHRQELGVNALDAEIPNPWLREVGVAERRPVRTSRDVTSGRSSRPRHRKVLYFPHRHLWIMEYSCKMQAHTQEALQAQLEAQICLDGAYEWCTAGNS
ncbi:hypothetical protein Taro_017958 [Colocasia esculenta]|uniref:Uncharacterized protein n=1 Tax=Colocasia esculenta TaxID=4460 RepID=A0A843UXM4_COLES|nr:hypothetical protein [Colocasia esculenta]